VTLIDDDGGVLHWMRELRRYCYVFFFWHKKILLCFFAFMNVGFGEKTKL
jgi:hypothetical protein